MIMQYYEKIIEQINDRKDLQECLCPKCGYKTSFEYQSSRSSYLEEWYRCSVCKNTFQPNYLGAYNKLKYYDSIGTLK